MSGIPTRWEFERLGPTQGYIFQVLTEDRGQIALRVHVMGTKADSNARYIEDACNNYERVKSERDQLFAALRVAYNRISELGGDSLQIHRENYDSLQVIEKALNLQGPVKA